MSLVAQSQGTSVGAEIHLFELRLPTKLGGAVYRFTPSSDDPLSFGGIIYTRMPITIDGLGESGESAPPQPTLTISLADPEGKDSNFAPSVLAGLDLRGSLVIYIATFENFLDGQPDANPTEHRMPQIWEVERIQRMDTETAVTYELANPAAAINARVPSVSLSQACARWYRNHAPGDPEADPNGFTYDKGAADTGLIALDILDARTIARGAGSFIDDDLEPGMELALFGFVSNSGVWQAQRVSDTQVTVATTPTRALTPEIGGGGQRLLEVTKQCPYGSWRKVPGANAYAVDVDFSQDDLTGWSATGATLAHDVANGWMEVTATDVAFALSYGGNLNIPAIEYGSALIELRRVAGTGRLFAIEWAADGSVTFDYRLMLDTQDGRFADWTTLGPLVRKSADWTGVVDAIGYLFVCDIGSVFQVRRAAVAEAGFYTAGDEATFDPAADACSKSLTGCGLRFWNAAQRREEVLPGMFFPGAAI